MRLWRGNKRFVFAYGMRGRFNKGITIIEVLVSSALLILGVSVAIGLSNFMQRSERNSILSLTANRLAQDFLERVMVENCIWNSISQVCQNLTERSGALFSVWVKPDGRVEHSKPLKADGSLEDGVVEFEVRFDVHATSDCLSGLSDVHCVASLSDNSAAWGLDRSLFGEAVGNLHNVRITVSYIEPFQRRVRFVSYQTRIAP